MAASRLKFGGFRWVRPPKHIMNQLHREHRARGRGGPLLYCIRRATPAEMAERRKSYVAFLCDWRGRHIVGVPNHYFSPIRYPRKPRSAQSVAPPPAPASPPDAPAKGEPVAAPAPPPTGDGQPPVN